MTDANNDSQLGEIDASTFQRPLARLAEVLAQKVYRESPKMMPAPNYVSHDLFVLTRKAQRTYDLLFFLSADEWRTSESAWKRIYPVVALPLVRNLIDCLYNITAILQAPSAKGAEFRRSGFRNALRALERDEKYFGGEEESKRWLDKMRSQLDLEIRRCGMSLQEVSNQLEWPTLGLYINTRGKGGTTTPHQKFLDRFTQGSWREYSAMAHGTFEGLLRVEMFFIDDTLMHEERPELDEIFPRVISRHLARTAALLLCIVTELQLYFRFSDCGARIDERINEMWEALMPLPEAKDLYENHYRELLKSKVITL